MNQIVLKGETEQCCLFINSVSFLTLALWSIQRKDSPHPTTHWAWGCLHWASVSPLVITAAASDWWLSCRTGLIVFNPARLGLTLHPFHWCRNGGSGTSCDLPNKWRHQNATQVVTLSTCPQLLSPLRSLCPVGKNCSVRMTGRCSGCSWVLHMPGGPQFFF